MTETAIDRVRKYVYHEYSHDNIFILQSDLVNMTSGDLRSLIDAIDAQRAALMPFATALRLAKTAFDGPADRAHLEAIASTYIRYNDLVNAESILEQEEDKK